MSKCFVFGSNEAGIHGAGAALHALNEEGAVWGIGFGHVGNSFAIPTKNRRIKSLKLNQIKHYVGLFLAYAAITPTIEYKVTRIGCGFAGFSNEEIAPLFIEATPNCYFDKEWEPYLPNNFKYWGTQ